MDPSVTEDSSGSGRKKRPSLQIYQPGALKRTPASPNSGAGEQTKLEAATAKDSTPPPNVVAAKKNLEPQFQRDYTSRKSERRQTTPRKKQDPMAVESNSYEINNASHNGPRTDGQGDRSVVDKHRPPQKVADSVPPIESAEFGFGGAGANQSNAARQSMRKGGRGGSKRYSESRNIEQTNRRQPNETTGSHADNNSFKQGQQRKPYNPQSNYSREANSNYDSARDKNNNNGIAPHQPNAAPVNSRSKRGSQGRGGRRNKQRASGGMDDNDDAMSVASEMPRKNSRHNRGAWRNSTQDVRQRTSSNASMYSQSHKYNNNKNNNQNYVLEWQQANHPTATSHYEDGTGAGQYSNNQPNQRQSQSTRGRHGQGYNTIGGGGNNSNRPRNTRGRPASGGGYNYNASLDRNADTLPPRFRKLRNQQSTDSNSGPGGEGGVGSAYSRAVPATGVAPNVPDTVLDAAERQARNLNLFSALISEDNHSSILDWSLEVENNMARQSNDSERSPIDERPSASTTGGVLVLPPNTHVDAGQSLRARSRGNTQAQRGTRGLLAKNNTGRSGYRNTDNRAEHYQHESVEQDPVMEHESPAYNTDRAMRSRRGTGPHNRGQHSTTMTNRADHSDTGHYRADMLSGRGDRDPNTSIRARHHLNMSRGSTQVQRPSSLMSMSLSTVPVAGGDAVNNTNTNSVSTCIADRAPDAALINAVSVAVRALNQFMQTITNNPALLDEDELCAKIMNVGQEYHRLLPANLLYTYKHNLEQQLWLDSYYTVLEELRKAPDTHQALFNRIIDMGSSYYMSLVESLSHQAGIDHKQYLFFEQHSTNSTLFSTDISAAVLRETHTTHNKHAKLTLSSVARLMLALGDLQRYRAQNSRNMDFAKARTWYLKSQQLCPSNGRAYNQLAILALHTQRVVEMMYYYMRALSAKYKFEAAKHGLDQLINELGKRVTRINSEMHEQAKAIHASSVGKSTGAEEQLLARSQDAPAYIQIWHDNKGSQAVLNDTLADTHKSIELITLELLADSSVRDLYKRVLLYVLHACGIVYSKIGMEHFEDTAERALVQLRALLCRQESPMTDVQLVQLCTVCMHTVHHTAPQDTTVSANSTMNECSVQHNRAVQFTFSVWALLLDVVCAHTQPVQLVRSLLQGQLPLAAAQCPPAVAHVQRVLPALSLMCRWLSTPAVYKIWSRSLVQGIETPRFSLNIWSSFADVWNRLDQLVTNQCLLEVNHERTAKYEQAVLVPEDALTLSFNGSFELSRPTVYMSNVLLDTTNMEYSALLYALHRRLASVHVCGYFLQGSSHQNYLVVGADNKLQAATRNIHHTDTATLALSQHTNTTHEEASAQTQTESLAASVHARNVQEGNTSTDSLHADLGRLHLQQTEQAAKEAVFAAEHCVNALIWDVMPTFLIPDTNALIDHLQAIVQLAQAKMGYNIVVPVIVANELVGLGQGNRLADTVDNQWLRQRANQAFNTLKHLADTQHNVYALTQAGNKMKSFDFLTEDETVFRKNINDDKILACCKHLIEDDVRPAQDLRNEPVRLQRKMVLLTDDRALRFKCLSATVPVRSVPSFMQWARL